MILIKLYYAITLWISNVISKYGSSYLPIIGTFKLSNQLMTIKNIIPKH